MGKKDGEIGRFAEKNKHRTSNVQSSRRTIPIERRMGENSMAAKRFRPAEDVLCDPDFGKLITNGSAADFTKLYGWISVRGPADKDSQQTN